MPPDSSIRRPAHAQVVSCLLGQGHHALNAGYPDVAAGYFREVVKLQPLSVDGWQSLAATQTGARRAICLRWAAYAQKLGQPASPVGTRASTRSPARRWSRALVAASATAGLFLATLLGSDLAYRDRVLPGVLAGGVELDNLPRAAAIERVAAEHARLEGRVVILDAGDRVWQVRAADLLHDSWRDAAAAALAYGHDPSLMSRAEARLRAVLGQQYRVELIQIDTQALERVVAALAAALAQERRDAQILRAEHGWIVTGEQTGRVLDQAAAIGELARALRLSAASPSPEPVRLSLPIRYESPRRTAAELEPARRELESLRSMPLTLRAGDRSWTLDRSLLVAINESASGIGVQPDESAIRALLDTVAGEIDAPPQPSRLVREGDRVRELVWGQAGIELDRETARAMVTDAIRQGIESVDLPRREVAPPPGEVEQLGLIAEIGRGDSQFASYTSPERDANVVAGGQDVDGVLIGPGELFSFNATVGMITVDKGYQWGEMIEAGSVVPSLGGGICQVSTTVFRAAFWSGLEIVERHPHSWRLPWYEADAPPGMDATIALGGPDLRFRNNTDHHILIRVETDLQQKRQTVRLYGTPDGRTVAMQPFVSGAVGIYREVQQGGVRLAEETFMSYYTQ